MSNTWWKDEGELIKEQADILDFDLEKNLLIKGPPGSGKTNLLLLKANQFFLGDFPNLHIVVFGSVLRNFIQLGGSQYKFPADKIVTHARLFSRILDENDSHVDTKGMKIMEARVARASALKALIDQGRVGAMYDALLLDEAQDYTSDEIRIFRALTNILVAASDVRQKIFAVDDSSEILEHCTDELYVLKYHFRNGRDICRLADAIMKGKPDHTPLLPYSNYDEGEYPSKVFPRPGLNLQQQAEAIANQIVDQRIAYPNDLVGVLCPRNEEVDFIAAHLKTTALAKDITRCGDEDFDAARNVWLSTMSGAKGLEFRAVHLAGLDFLANTGAVQRRLAFTGVTRAKTALSLYFENSVPGYLDSAIRSSSPEKKQVTKASIFGKE
jgi:superfamily I DNA/RNA helicase